MKLLGKRKPKIIERGDKNDSVVNVHTELVAIHFDKNGNEIQRRVVHNKVVTNSFVYHLVDVLQGTSGKFDLFKWHDSGQSTVAEAQTQTVLLARVSTNRTAGTQVESGSSNAYRSVATKSYTSTKSITEHGLFNVSTTGLAGEVMMDRTLFTVINVSNGDSIQFTFTITFSAGG